MKMPTAQCKKISAGAHCRFATGNFLKSITLKLKNRIDILDNDFIKLSLFADMRKANLLSIDWKDVSFSHNTGTIGDTKLGTS